MGAGTWGAVHALKQHQHHTTQHMVLALHELLGQVKTLTLTSYRQQ